MIKWFFLFLFGGIATVAISLYFKLGAYKDVEIQVQDVAQKHLLFKKHFGAYHKISPVIQAVEEWAIKNDVNCDLSYGAYYDDPKTVEEDRLNSEGGCLTTEALSKDKLPLDFSQRIFEANKYIVATFHGSPAIGPFVVYPKVEEWAIDNRYKLKTPYYETYKIVKNKVITTYYFPFD